MRRLRFVRDAGSAPAAEADTTVIVLDVAWTPTPRSRADVVPIRPVFGAVTARYDLFDTALEFLDGWADEAGIAERAMVGDVTYWFRVREMMWRWLHERLLWRYVVAELGGLDEPIELVIDADEPALVDVGTALGVLASRAAPEPSAASSPVSRVVARLSSARFSCWSRPSPLRTRTISPSTCHRH